MKIAFLTNIPSPYRMDFFNELGKYCELTVFFEKGKSDERDDSWTNYSFKNFRGIILEGKSVSTDKAFSPSVKQYLKKGAFDHIIVCNAFTPTGIVAMRHMKKHHISYWIEGDGAFPRKDNHLKKWFKTWILKGAKGYFSTSDTHDQYYLSYGVQPDQIFRYPFTSVKKANLLDKPVDIEEKRNLKKQLGILEDKMVLSVGQFIHRKGFDVLLQATEMLNKTVGIYIIGGNPTEEMADYVDKHALKNVHFLPFQTPEMLRQYYMASDVFALPTREDIWGLVVNEAMAAAVPVVTTQHCVSGLTLVLNGKNGFVVPVEDPKALAEAITKVLESDADQMAAAALETAKTYTIEAMVRTHIDILKKY